MAGHRNCDTARRTASRMAQQLTFTVTAAFMLFTFTILAARMWQNHCLVIWLFIATTKAFVPRQRIFSIIEVAIRASPGKESEDRL